MKKQAKAQLHQQDISSLRQQLTQLAAELMQAEFKRQAGKLANHRQVYTLRKDLARLHTIIRAKELASLAAGK